MFELHDIGKKYGTDKVEHDFLNHYEKYTNHFRYNDVNVMEIGVFHGASIKMWHEYFPNGTIYAVDWWKGLNGNNNYFSNPDLFINESINYPRTKTVNLNQHNTNELEKMVEQMSDIKFDLILDDGSHLSQDQQQTFGYLWKLVKPGGYYIIEDIHCSLNTGYDVFPDGSNSTLNMLYNYNENGIIESIYMTEKQKMQLQTEIDGQIYLGFKNLVDKYKFDSGTAIIKKL
jgi:hypothetical protein